MEYTEWKASNKHTKKRFFPAPQASLQLRLHPWVEETALLPSYHLPPSQAKTVHTLLCTHVRCQPTDRQGEQGKAGHASSTPGGAASAPGAADSAPGSRAGGRAPPPTGHWDTKGDPAPSGAQQQRHQQRDCKLKPGRLRNRVLRPRRQKDKCKNTS